jgi:2-oxo-4-hydroxy-4-carboxy-5-ureidoimidazoline decarboxylase
MTPSNLRVTPLPSRDREGVGLTDFVQTYGWIFEDSPWVAERAFPKAPFHSIDELHAAMVDVVKNATREEQLALLQAHPDLGARRKMSEASTNEQASIGLEEEFALNAAYKQKHGFPFLYAVKGSTKEQIRQALEARLDNPTDVEFAEALRQVYRIALFRLQTTATPNP